ncbi:MAG: two-component system, OmpR family, sensor histidine kinase KdpD [Acidimicrobiaceae bacterium]|nr:two-component system, OmpR family, sensor histidine kinase KdpD [Acidimicrobiaceae bacterium]
MARPAQSTDGLGHGVETGRVSRAEQTGGMERGHLRIYIGAASGVGTTFALLEEGLRRCQRGSNVLVAGANTRGRPNTAKMLRELDGAATVLPAVDVSAIVHLRPDVALVDELAHVEGLAHARAYRWQQVLAVLDAGIDVVTTLKVEQIESLADPVRKILGTAPVDSVPDDFLQRAEQIELVDITPEAIRRRIAHGNVFDADAPDLATMDLFNGSGFAELRALLICWLADRLTAGADDPREARERVVVAVTAASGSDVVVRRAARLAQRTRAELIAVHVRSHADAPAAELADRRALVEALGGRYHELAGQDVAEALVEFATTERATQLVVGTRARPAIATRRADTFVNEVIRRAGTLDVHITSYPTDSRSPSDRRGASSSPLPRGRRTIGFGVAAVLLTVLTLVLTSHRDAVSVSSALSLYLLAVVLVAAVGGGAPALAAAVASPLVVNWFLIPPHHTLRIGDAQNVLSLIVFVSVALIVSRFVSTAARRSAEAARLRDEATTLAALAGSAGPDPMASISAQLQQSFGLEGVSVLRVDDGGETTMEASSGPRPPSSISEATFHEVIGPGVVLAVTGRALSADDHRVLRSFVQQLAKANEQHRLASLAAQAESLDRADELRTSLLRAVSHDLRTPLAGIKASVSSLRQPDVDWPEEARAEFLTGIEADTDRLTEIVVNLLDLSRLQAGALRPRLSDIALDDVIAAALHSLGGRSDRVKVDLGGGVIGAVADPALLERVIANLVANALVWSPVEQTVQVRVFRRHHDVQLYVIDHGPGIRPRDRAMVVQPFHRLDDSTSQGGLGLGLAIANGFTEAMGASLELRDTPGGGLTAVVSLATESV